MPKPLGLQSQPAQEAERELGYRVELICEGGAPELVCACVTAGIGYAAYYAAMREHFGRRVRLSKGGQTLAQT